MPGADLADLLSILRQNESRQANFSFERTLLLHTVIFFLPFWHFAHFLRTYSFFLYRCFLSFFFPRMNVFLICFWVQVFCGSWKFMLLCVFGFVLLQFSIFSLSSCTPFCILLKMCWTGLCATFLSGSGGAPTVRCAEFPGLLVCWMCTFPFSHYAIGPDLVMSNE